MRVLALFASVLLAVACGGGGPTLAPSSPSQATSAAPTPTAAALVTPTPPTAAATAAATPTAVPTVAPATPIASADPAEVAVWAEEICDTNSDFNAANIQASADFPEPSPRALESVQATHAARRPAIEANLSAALSRLAAVMPLAGGEAFRAALIDELQGTLDTLPTFYDAIAAAATLEDLDRGVSDYGTAQSARLLNSARAVSEIDLAFSDEIAVVDSGCRFFEADARARPHNRQTPNFTETEIEETFDAPSDFTTGPFEGGEVQVAAGALTISFTSATTKAVWTDNHEPSMFHDVRVEANFSVTGSALAGLVCRADGDKSYTIVVNPIGLVLIYKGGESPLLGRRVAPEGFDGSPGVHLAVECVGGNLEPALIVVYLNGERVAEVVDETRHAAEGFAGMFAQGFGPGSMATYVDFTVSVPSN